MRRLSDRFAEAAQACPDLPQLAALLRDATQELGFHYFALLDHASLGGVGRGLLRIDNYPKGWVEEIVASGDAADDPVHLASRRTNVAFRWRDLGNLIRLERRHIRILSRSRRHGLGPGLTVPANVPGEPSASCSFAVRAGGEMPGARLHCAELIGAYALAAGRRLRPPAPRARPHLAAASVSA